MGPAIIAVVLMPKAGSTARRSLAGWIVGLAVVGTLVLLISSGASASTDPARATWGSVPGTA
jgi:hypothetical protein